MTDGFGRSAPCSLKNKNPLQVPGSIVKQFTARLILVVALTLSVASMAAECKQDGPGKEDNKPDPIGTWVTPSPTPPCLQSKGGCVSVPPKQ